MPILGSWYKTAFILFKRKKNVLRSKANIFTAAASHGHGIHLGISLKVNYYNGIFVQTQYFVVTKLFNHSKKLIAEYIE